MSSDSNQTILIKVFCCLFANIRDISSKFLHSPLGVTHFQNMFINMNRSKYIFTHNAITYHNSILEVVSLPGHKCHFQVTSKCKITAFGTITLCKHIAFLKFLSFMNYGAYIQGWILVGFMELIESVTYNIIMKTHKTL